jgi:cardiolipin synthase A/B
MNPGESTFKELIKRNMDWLQRLPQPEFFSCKQLLLVRSGQEYFELLENLINHATHTVHLQAYIFQSDETGKRVGRALKNAARRGVHVFVVVDGYASQELTSKFIRKLKEAGVHFKFFSPLLKSKNFYFGRRLHHKVVTIDDRFALVGGINISDNYNDTLESPAWLDWALYAEGDIAVSLRHICERRALDNPTIPNNTAPTDKPKSNSSLVRIRVNDWVRRKRDITISYIQMLQHAKSHVTIMSSYFLPGKVLKRQMKLASNRGVKIRVIMGQRSDVTISRLAEQYMYRWLLRNNIEIYEYTPKIVHSKLAVFDGHWLTVGSYNVNNISAYASIELNLDVKDTDFVKKVEQRLERIMTHDCVLITEEDYYQKTTLWSKFLQRSAYDIFRVMLFVFTFYFKQRD